ncbi:MAG: hypothetical protein ACREPL_10495 [Rhodanobacteraceae bacterium]
MNTGVDRDGIFAHDLAQQLVTVLAVGIVHEDGATIHATLGNVKGNPGDVQSWLPWHGPNVAEPAAWRSGKGLVDSAGGVERLSSADDPRPHLDPDLESGTQ